MPEELVIQVPRTGIAQSPHIGFGASVNLDIDSVPGVCKLNNILENKANWLVAQPNWFVRNPSTIAEVYTLDSSGFPYKSSDSGASWANITGMPFTVTIASPAVFTATGHGLVANDTVVFRTTGALPTGLTAGTTYYVISAGLTADAFEVSTSQGGAAVDTSGSQSGTHNFIAKTNGNGNGMVIWKDYLFIARNTKLDAYGPLASSPTWTWNWKTIDSDTLWHPMLVSKNDSKLYGGAGRYIFSLDEVSGQTFAPATSGTYTFTQQALDLPTSYRIKCIEELGNYLLAGTWQGTNIYDIRVADIFPWDRSAVSFGQPIQINDYGVHAMKNIGNSLIVLAGISGTIYKSDGSSAYPIGQLPIDISGGKYLEWYPNSLCYYKNKICFGSGNGGTTAIAGQGVYSLQQTSQGNILNLEHQNSSLTDGSAASVKYSALLPITRDTLLVGFRSNTTYSVDLTTATAYNYGTDYSSYFESPLYKVGTYNNKTSFTEVEFTLAKELASGEGLQISYRVNLTDTYTTLKNPDGSTLSLTYTALGAVTSHRFIADIPACEMLQIKVALLGSSTTTPQLRSVILR